MSAVGDALADIRQRFPDAQRLVVAYSGGRDSHVLLHAARQQSPLPVRALHVVHGLQSVAAPWPQHCERVCAALDVPLDVVEATVVSAGQGLEAAAREARYDVFAQQINPHDLLLQAHHAEDQAETLLLRLMRGTGIRGMAAMPTTRALGQGILWRPLLGVSSKNVAQYAAQMQLEWIEDPSNRDTQFDRNYLRQKVTPLLSERWPKMAMQLSAAARRAGEAESLLAELIEPKLEQLISSDGGLSCDGLLAASTQMQRYLLRAWLAKHRPLAPTESQLRAALRDVLRARRDADPRLYLGGGELRRHREYLYWVPTVSVDTIQTHQWDDTRVPLKVGDELLSLDSDFGKRLIIPEQAVVQIRFRQGGERIRLRSGERALKKLLQDHSVPSWRRDRTALLYLNDEFAAVWNISIAAKYEKSVKKQ